MRHSAQAIKLGVSALALVAAGPAMAQTQLPGITVTSPSPVARPQPTARPAPVSQVPTTVTAPAPAPAVQAAPQPGTPPAPVTPPPVQPGLVIVDDAFVPVTVVTREDVLSKAGPTITDTLAQKPGVAGSTFAPGANRPIIRGLDNHRVRIQENGIGSG
ncbi:MAG: hypothetical protein RL291_1530, partial [Pseudomonadota bacterium]